MPIKILFQLAFNTMVASRLRTFLSMLGIIIGTGSVIASLSLGESLKAHTLAQVRQMGSSLLMVFPARRQFRGVTSGSYQNLELDDALALMKLEEIQAVSPIMQSSFQIKAMTRNMNAEVVGTASSYLGIHQLELEEGRYFSDFEERSARFVCIIGSQIAEELFPSQSTLGKTLKIQGRACEVIGLLKERGQQGHSPDSSILIPFTAAASGLMGRKSLSRIDISAVSEDLMTQAALNIEKVMRRQHKIRPDQETDVRVVNMAQVLETLEGIGLALTIFLGLMAGISLLVGGIGIMNIMLANVAERTQEIGIRKAIGATDRDIQLQFLIEALTLTLVGGVAGLVLSTGFIKLIGLVSGYPAVIPWLAVFMGLGSSTLIGLFFGWHPARSAARLDPIECLRHE